MSEHDERETDTTRHRDRGTTFLEVLIAVVLLGTVVVGTLAALRATIIGTTIERDHSKAHEWLQSASEFVTSPDRLMFLDCDAPLTGAQIRTSYQDDLRLETGIIPDGWQDGQISISSDVIFAGASGAYSPTCFADIDRQLVVIRVNDTAGRIVEQVEVVKAAP